MGFKFTINDTHGPVTGPGGIANGNRLYNDRYSDALTPQTKRMNDEHIAQLVSEWKSKHQAEKPIGMTTAAFNAQQNRLAKEWAAKVEPKRFLNPLLYPMNGIKADQKMRRNSHGNTAILGSSWVGDAEFNDTAMRNPTQVTFKLNGKPYTFKLSEIGGFDGLKQCLSSPSIGSYMCQNWFHKLPSSKVNWKTDKKGNIKPPHWIKKSNLGL